MASVVASGTVEARGQVWRLSIESDMVWQLQKLTGLKPKRLLALMLSGAGDVSLMRQIVLVALQRHHPGTSIEVAGDIISEDLASVGALMIRGADAWRPKGTQPGRGPMLH